MTNELLGELHKDSIQTFGEYSVSDRESDNHAQEAFHVSWLSKRLKNGVSKSFLLEEEAVLKAKQFHTTLSELSV